MNTSLTILTAGHAGTSGTAQDWLVIIAVFAGFGVVAGFACVLLGSLGRRLGRSPLPRQLSLSALEDAVVLSEAERRRKDQGSSDESGEHG